MDANLPHRHDWMLEITLQYENDNILTDSLTLEPPVQEGEVDQVLSIVVDEGYYGLRIIKTCVHCSLAMEGTTRFSDGTRPAGLTGRLPLNAGEDLLELERTPAVQGRLVPR